jgi:hypothetical protein
MIPRVKYLSASAIALGVALASSACGRTSLDDLEDENFGAGVDGGDHGNTAPRCGDGKCIGSESCTSCAVDCGVCAGCGDHACASSESCTSCPEDCGVCQKCGDGFCKDDETCLSCAPDCGKCASCGDGKCAAGTEDCFSCPDDCGVCKSCGDGLCSGAETCASCTHDCGICAVCGNKKCEGPYETCSNCHDDCGDCELLGCLPMLTCAFKCIDPGTNPPHVGVTCVADCVSRGCPAAKFLFDQAFNCFLQHLNECGARLECLEKKCDPEVAACIGANCAQ